MPKGGSAPVGCVLAYAGETSALKGWRVCDGAALQIKDHPHLHDVIGTIYGGDGVNSFAVPNYKGYFLRGLDPAGDVDKGAENRTSPAGGRVTGPIVGSVQNDYTARPTIDPLKTNPPDSPFFTQTIDFPLSSNLASALTGGSETLGLDRGMTPNQFYSSGGGDAETRPINVYVNFIIKTEPDAAMPTGAVIAFAGNKQIASDNHGSYYKLCNGTQLDANESRHTELLAAIGTAHGGDRSTFNVPDYRGQFLRGANKGAGRDPEAAQRTAMARGGAVGDAVGSVQEWTTRQPRGDPFESDEVDLPSLATARGWTGGWHTAALPLQGLSVDFTQSGGNAETRPVNKYVDFYILSQADPNETDIFPIGGIIGFAGSGSPSNDLWIQCRGQTCEKNLPRYKALYAAIQDDNGGSDAEFSLPNYDGYFLRGKDHGAGRDPDASLRGAAEKRGQTGDNVGSVQGYATGKPKTPITGAVTLPNHVSTAASLTRVYAWGVEKKLEILDGGDGETCPINAGLFFYIRYYPNT